MSRSTFAAVPHIPRRTWLIAAGVVVAVLIAAALVINPQPSTSDSQPSLRHQSETTAPSSGSVDIQALRGSTDSSTQSITEAAASGGGSAFTKSSSADSADAPAPVTEADSDIGSGAGAGTGAGAQFGLHIVQNAELTLKVKRKHFDAAWGDASAIAASMGGYVVQASTSGRKLHGVGTIQIRVPAKRFDAAVKRFTDIGSISVVSRSVASDDVSQEYVDTASRLRHHKAVEARLVTLLGKTEKIGDVLAVQSRIDAVQEKLEVEQGRLNWLDGQSSMSTISVTMREGAAAAKPDTDTGTPWGVRTAFSDAGHRFVDNVNSAVVGIGGALPALLVLGFAALILRTVVRRRRRPDQTVVVSED